MGRGRRTGWQDLALAAVMATAVGLTWWLVGGSYPLAVFAASLAVGLLLAGVSYLSRCIEVRRG